MVTFSEDEAWAMVEILQQEKREAEAEGRPPKLQFCPKCESLTDDVVCGCDDDS